MNTKNTIVIGILGLAVLGLFTVGIVLAYKNDNPVVSFKKESEKENISIPQENQTIPTHNQATEITQEQQIQKESVPHIETPSEVRALYMSAWVAATPNVRKNILNIISNTSINSIVIDIKDATGRVSFLVDDPVLNQLGSPRNLIRDIQPFLKELHEKNIYVIGRISVFQDDYMTKHKPEWAIKSKSTGNPWKDKKGLAFLDPTNKEVWDYTIRIAKASYEVGFDEINFDYIRFPSDGNISDISYPTSEGTKVDAIEHFFQGLHDGLKDTSITTSADLFGMTTNNTDDLGIGQVLERSFPYFDFIAPMIYPSHYPKGFHGIANPAEKPYQVITIAMKKGVERAIVAGYGPEKFRPWIQDFNLGAVYTQSMVQDQIRALSELGITSFMSWDPANKYTQGAYLIR